MIRFRKWIESLFEEHKLVRRLMVLWAIILITIIVLATFDDLSLVTASVAAALASVVGMLSVVIGFYIQSRKLDDERKHDANS